MMYDKLELFIPRIGTNGSSRSIDASQFNFTSKLDVTKLSPSPLLGRYLDLVWGLRNIVCLYITINSPNQHPYCLSPNNKKRLNMAKTAIIQFRESENSKQACNVVLNRGFEEWEW